MKQPKRNLSPQTHAYLRLKMAAVWRSLDDHRRQMIDRHLFVINRLAWWPWAQERVWQHLDREFARLRKIETENLTEEERQTQFDQKARDLYEPHHTCLFCCAPFSAAVWLSQAPCPKCGRVNSIEPLKPQEAQDMLHQYQARRQQLGLTD